LLLRGVDSRREAVGYSLVLGGALGNVVDRMVYGAVVDYLDFYLGDWHWPAFNLADAAILLGILLLLWNTRSPGKDTRMSAHKRATKI
jgi:signal peptidase II